MFFFPSIFNFLSIILFLFFLRLFNLFYFHFIPLSLSFEFFFSLLFYFLYFRTTTFWDEIIIPQLKAKKRILIVGHENNLRSIIKRLDDISETDILQLELPRAIPLIYELDAKTFKPIKKKKIIIDSTMGNNLLNSSISPNTNSSSSKKEKINENLYEDTYKGVGVEVEMLSG